MDYITEKEYICNSKKDEFHCVGITGSALSATQDRKNVTHLQVMMKKKYFNFRWIALVIACLTCFHTAMAYDTCVDDIYYDVTEYSDGSAVALVAHNGSENTYSGFVTIPATINYNNKEVRVTGVGYRAFKNSTGLTGVSIPEGATMLLNEAFAGCTGLTSITLPSTMSSIYNNAFTGCTNLMNVTCMRLDAKTCNENNFDDATYANATLHIPFEAYNSYSNTSPWSRFANLEQDQKFVVDGIYYYVKSLSTVKVTYKDAAFNSYRGALTIPATVTYNGKTYDVVAVDDDAFRDCTSLESVVLPNSVEIIGDRAFYNCGQDWIDIDLGSGVYSIGSEAFYSNSVVNLICQAPVPPSVQSNTFVGDFFRDSRLFVPYRAVSAYLEANYWGAFTEDNTFGIYDFMVGDNYFSITGSNTVSVCTMAICANGAAFYARYDYTVIPGIDIPAEVTYDGVTYQVTAIDQFAFGACSQLKTVSLPDGILSIGYAAFYDCSALNDITFPNTLSSIDDRAFLRCTGLHEVNVPNSVKSIGNYAFAGCDSIEHITLGSGLEFVGLGAFYMDDNLIDVTCKAAVPPATNIDNPVIFTTQDYENATLYVPHASLSDYQNAPGWQDFFTKVPTYTLDDALNVDGGTIHFESTGDYPWKVIVDGGGNWIYARSGNQGVHSSVSELTATVDVPTESILSFTYQAWGEGTATLYDKCIFLIDGIQQFCYGARQNDWELYSVHLQPGTHNLSWKYTKDSSVNLTGDYFALNDVAITPTFVRGDVDGDGNVSIADVTTLIDYLLSGDASAVNLAAADADLDGGVSIADVTALIDYLLSGEW